MNNRVMPCLHPKRIRANARRGALTARFAGTLGVFLLAFSQLGEAACTITSTSVAFGAYNVFSAPAVPNDTGVGTVVVACRGGGSASSFPVDLSTGQSNSYAVRQMNSGANLLNYNLYTNIARTTVWGNGTGGTSRPTVKRQATTTLSVYGRIPGGQDAAVGNYADTIIATVSF